MNETMLFQALPLSEKAFLLSAIGKILEGKLGMVLHEDGIILKVNPVICNILRRPVIDLIGKDILTQLCHPDSVLVTAIGLQHEESYRCTLIRGDGSPVEVDILHPRFIAYNGRRARIAFVQEITVQRIQAVNFCLLGRDINNCRCREFKSF